MSAELILVWLIVGAVAGWLAGMIVRGGGFGLLGDIIIGIVGAFVGGWLAGLVGISVTNVFMLVVVAFVGAVILLVIFRAVTGRGRMRA